MKNQPLVIERTFNASPERIWQAITVKDQMKEWYFELSDFKPEVGFEFHFTGGAEDRLYVHQCRVTEVVVNRKLTYTWAYEGYPGISYLSFELFPEGTGTRVRLTHTGLETFGNQGDFAVSNFTAGWTEIIGSMLKKFVERSSG